MKKIFICLPIYQDLIYLLSTVVSKLLTKSKVQKNPTLFQAILLSEKKILKYYNTLLKTENSENCIILS